ncbi:MCE family protein [Rhodococcus sp. HNM0569]|uniref:MCE family protein n=1 Tax=Rhodococcus sp. HNM0569 TaxID=2716340 RepID=UPI00146F4B79|nr:MCE family protein [Rhodococcus sp. HNM0569]NLU83304.1 MCE family protein [Rhodococcus sp. HNM0569]
MRGRGANTSTPSRAARFVVPAVLAVLLVAGCGRTGLNSLSLPGTEGRGAGSYSVDIVMPDVSTITENSPVMVDDVTVGSIAHIRPDGWNARVTVRLNGDVRLPANSHATIGQTSLLGSQHVALAPPTDEAPTGTLEEGDVIPIERAGVYPTTEQTLSALSVVLNGGGIDQLHTVTGELGTALEDTDSTRSLLTEADTLTTSLDDQRGDLVDILDRLDTISGNFAAQRGTLADALDRLGPALEILASERRDLTGALESASRLGAAAERLSTQSKQDLIRDLENLSTTLKYLADSGQDVIGSVDSLATFPFPQIAIEKGVKGDFTNLFLTIDLTVDRLRSGLAAGTALGPSAAGPEAIVGMPAGPTSAATDPLLGPLSSLLPQVPALPELPGLPPLPGGTP